MQWAQGSHIFDLGNVCAQEQLLKSNSTPPLPQPTQPNIFFFYGDDTGAIPNFLSFTVAALTNYTTVWKKLLFCFLNREF